MWDQSGDNYNHEQLAANFARIDFHDHTNGRGVQLTTESISPGAIDKTLLALEAVQLTNLSPEIQSKLSSAVTGNSALKVTVGTGTAAWTSSATSATATITHTLGKTPTEVFITNSNSAATGQPISYVAFNYTGTTFQVIGYAASSVTLAGTYNWLAVG